MWGTYWVWDARLTSVLVLFILYLGLMALWRAIDDPGRAAKAAAILTLVGAVDLPIIKFSVDWWNTLHQPASVMKLGGPSIHPAILTPLLWMAVSFLLLFILLVLLRTETEIDRRRLDAAERERAQTAVADGLLVSDGDRLVLTNRGRLLADAVVRNLLG